jgi:hypothetical protein
MKFDKISEMENQARDNEADAVALEWFNQHLKELNNPYAKQITVEEINKMRQKNKDLMEKLYKGG